MTQSIESQIVEIVAQQTLREATEVREATDFEELGLDSLAMVEVIFQIEEAFDISIPFNANTSENTQANVLSLKEIAATVEQLVSEKAA